MFKVRTTIEPVTWPVTLSEVKEKLHLTDDDNDSRLFALIKAVTKSVENFCGIAIGSQTKEFIYDFSMEPASTYVTPSAIRNGWVGSDKSLPYGPVISITSVARRDSGVTYTTLSPSEYMYDNGVIYNLGGINKIVYVTGYVTCPADLKEGILTEILYRYENVGNENKEGFSVEAMDYIIKHKDFAWE